MYCPMCGSKNEDDALFCFNCGASLSDGQVIAPVEASVVEAADGPYVTFDEPVEDRFQFNESPRMVANSFVSAMEKAEYEAEIARLRRSLMACRIGGVICAMLFVGLFGSYGALPLVALAGFLTPYGFAPIRRWVEGHGYFLILNWILIAFLFCLTMLFALFAGPIYAVYAHLKIAWYKQRLA